MVPMVVSLLWLASFIFDALAVSGLFDKRTILSSLPAAVLFLLAYDCIFVGFASIFGIPTGFILPTAAQVLLGLIFLLVRHKSSSNVKVRVADSLDMLVLVLMAVLVFACSYRQFGLSLELHYAASDPSRHVFETWKIEQTGLVAGQYAFWYLVSLGHQFVNGLGLSIPLYKVSITTDIFSLFLSGMLLYSLIKRDDNKWCRLTAAVLPLLYVVAYPLNIMVFGFGYLGFGINYCAAVIFAASFSNGRFIRYVTMSLALLGLIISYSLFVPPIFLSAFAAICFMEHGAGTSLKKTATIVFAVFLIPILIGFFIVFLGIFSELSVSEALSTEGGIYKNLFADFVFIAPAALFGLALQIKEDSRSFVCVASLSVLSYSLLMLGLGLVGIVSSYYFFKIHYLIWMLAFVVGAAGFHQLSADCVSVVPHYIVLWVLLAGFSFSGLDARFAAVRPMFNPSAGSDSLLPIVSFNRLQVGNTNAYPQEKIDLYGELDRLLLNDPMSSFTIVGPYSDVYWFEAITGRSAELSYYWNMSDKDLDKLYSSSDFVLLLNEATRFEDGMLPSLDGSSPYRFFDNVESRFNAAFKNSEGIILIAR